MHAIHFCNNDVSPLVCNTEPAAVDLPFYQTHPKMDAKKSIEVDQAAAKCECVVTGSQRCIYSSNGNTYLLI
jgi:hypothetical protein